MVLLVDDSAKKVAKTNMSSILVIANELHAVPSDFPNCMVASRAVTIIVFASAAWSGLTLAFASAEEQHVGSVKLEGGGAWPAERRQL